MTVFDTCPDCRARLPKVSDNAPVHRYLGASASCWAVFGRILNAGDPPMAAAPLNGLLIDAYAVQHPGKPSAQAIQSVAVHALVLHGVLERKMSPDQALWIRRRALREGGVHKHERYRWLDPPDFSGSLTIVDVVKGTDPVERARTAADYIHAVWKEWKARHGETLSAWFVDNVLA